MMPRVLTRPDSCDGLSWEHAIRVGTDAQCDSGSSETLASVFVSLIACGLVFILSLDFRLQHRRLRGRSSNLTGLLLHAPQTIEPLNESP